MEHTKNHHLPQWEGDDKIQMSDFNQMCKDLETGLTAAQQTADAAQATADTAFKPGQLPYVTGKYTGNGESQTIELGFRPSFVYISGLKVLSTTFAGNGLGEYTIGSAGNLIPELLVFTGTGFTVIYIANRHPQMNAEKIEYDYIAFR